MDIHQKHETDLTRKEKWQLEKEKLAGMNWKKKLIYIWDYYKPQIFGIIAFFLAIWAGFGWYEASKHEAISYVVAMDGYMTGEEEQGVEEAFKKYIQDTDMYHDVVIDTSVRLDTGDNLAMKAATMKLNTIVSAQAVDIIIASEEEMGDFIEAGMVCNLKEVFSAETFEKYKDRITDNGMLDVSDNQTVKETFQMGHDKEYLIVLTTSKNKETAGKFIEFLFRE